LGFSSFSIPVPSHLGSTAFKRLQFTLVDCPGHASLIRTIIGGTCVC
jgi:selenocysteine-specific elongation factor